VLDVNSSNNAIRKLISRFRKRSVDSRADTEHSIDAQSANAAMAANTNPNSGQSGARDRDPSFGAYSSTSIGTPAGHKGDTSSIQNRSNSGSIVALPTSGSGTKLITISERNEMRNVGPKSSIASTHASSYKKNSVTPSTVSRTPTLPPLSEATSVKQKWNILLSKAKGGVENIPKAFLSCSEANESVASNINDLFDFKRPEELDYNRKRSISSQHSAISNANTLVNMTYASPNVDLFGTMDKNTNINPIIMKTADTLDRLSTRSNRSKLADTLGVPLISHNLDESGGFYMEMERLEQEQARAMEEGNPQLLLSSLIECRRELKNEIEILNCKMSRLDKRISDVLLMMTSSSSINLLNNNQTTSTTSTSISTNNTNNAQLSLINSNFGSSKNEKDKSSNNTNNLLDIHGPRSTLNDSAYSFAINPNLHLSQLAHSIRSQTDMSSGSKNGTNKQIYTFDQTGAEATNLENVTLQIKTSTAPSTFINVLSQNKSVKENIKSPESISHVTTESIKPVATSTKSGLTSSSMHQHQHHHHHPHPHSLTKAETSFSNIVIKKPNLKTTSIAAVEGASNILSKVPAIQKSQLPSSATTSNYNVNLLTADSENRQMKTSSSVNEPFLRLIEKKKGKDGNKSTTEDENEETKHLKKNNK
jgi:hypothetical protein